MSINRFFDLTRWRQENGGTTLLTKMQTVIIYTSMVLQLPVHCSLSSSEPPPIRIKASDSLTFKPIDIAELHNKMHNYVLYNDE